MGGMVELLPTNLCEGLASMAEAEASDFSAKIEEAMSFTRTTGTSRLTTALASAAEENVGVSRSSSVAVLVVEAAIDATAGAACVAVVIGATGVLCVWAGALGRFWARGLLAVATLRRTTGLGSGPRTP